jgi:ArsR family transcriptional regulator
MGQLYEREAEFFQALGHPIRLRLLGLLAEGGRCACELQPELEMDQSTIARHLLTLKRAGILRSRKEGVRVIYELADERVLEVLKLTSALIIDSMKERLPALEAGRRS